MKGDKVRLHEFKIGKTYGGTIAGIEFQLSKDNKIYAYNTTDNQINHIPAKSIIQVNPADLNFIELRDCELN